jgi:uncharacterized protein (TIGR01777 family)
MREPVDVTAVPEASAARVIVSGASGLIGSRLVPFLTTGGHRVERLVRRASAREGSEIAWDPERGTIDRERLEGADAIVHLAGESVGAGRWTERQKEKILRSRIEGTRTLAEAIGALQSRPRVLVSASAIGFYGDRGDEELTEESPPGKGFLSRVCQVWEAATGAAAEAGIRVVHLRIGVVLSAAGGALARMLLPFRFGLGGPIGSGGQFMSWILLEDLVGAIQHAILNDPLSGAVNGVSPNAVTQAEFARTLGRVLGRPAFLPLPAPAVRVVLGEMGQALLLDGARVQPRKLLDSGFCFFRPDLGPALRTALGREGENP